MRNLTLTRLRISPVPLCVVAYTLLLPLQAQAQDDVKANYTKSEYRIPTRDGKRLFTAVYAPKDRSRQYPILLNRTPYSVSPYGVDRYRRDLGPSDKFAKEGYIFVYQDVRGRWMSEGDFVNMRPMVAHQPGSDAIDESTDTWDTIDWLIKNLENHNGRVGMWGISYPGFYTAAGLVDAHPALKAASPQAPIVDWFEGDDWHHHGALFLPHAFNFMATFGRPRPVPTKKGTPPFDHGTHDGYAFFLRLEPLANADARYFKGDVPFWNEVLQHGNYDEFWKSRNLRPHLRKIRPAVLTVGGWFDAENLFGALETYRTIEANNPDTPNFLVMGPWFHGGWARGTGDALGPVHFNSKTSTFYAESIEFPFFEHHLKNKTAAALPEAWVFETGRNEWRRHDAWPPRKARSTAYYFRENGLLATAAPEGSSDTSERFDEYVSDPAKPVPYFNETAVEMKREYMVGDQRIASQRPDVVTYETPTLENDVTFAGPLEADLVVSTSGTDSDWVVKLVDVYPDEYPDPEPNPAGIRMGGYQQLVRGDVLRGRFRKGLDAPEPFKPGTPTEVKFALQDIYHTFRTGHRIMVQVQSTWFPLVDRNPQTYVDIATAKESDFTKATQRIYRTPQRASRLKALLLP